MNNKEKIDETKNLLTAADPTIRGIWRRELQGHLIPMGAYSTAKTNIGEKKRA